MTTPSSISITISTYTHQQNPITRTTCKFLKKSPQPIKFYHLKCTKMDSFPQNCSNIKLCAFRNQGLLHGVRTGNLRRQKRVVLVKFNQFPNFNGGNDKRDDGTSARVLGNLALAVGLTYLTMTGQLGWVLDTIVSLWLLAIFVPVVGFGIFLWWAGRDIIQDSCPNCGNTFQVFNCAPTVVNPFQVFSLTLSGLLASLWIWAAGGLHYLQHSMVEGNEFVKEPIKSSKRSTPFGQTSDDFSPWSRKGKNASTSVVDIEAEVKDAE